MEGLELGAGVYGLATAALLFVYGVRWRRRTRVASAQLQAAQEAGLTQPASLHPVIDPSRCLGCATCVTACPEAGVLELIHRKAVLVNPTHCIGHGACRDACPQDAIELVLGTEERGVDVPVLDEGFQTTVTGIFVAGELGGMGLIRNAVEQGRQAMESIGEWLSTRPAGDPERDVIVVGAGPAGISAALAAQELGLSFELLEQETLGGTVAHYPRGKVVMTAPVHLPGYGAVRLRETTKEALLALWRDVRDRRGLRIREGVRVESIEVGPRGFDVSTNGGVLRARAVLLAIGLSPAPLATVHSRRGYRALLLALTTAALFAIIVATFALVRRAPAQDDPIELSSAVPCQLEAAKVERSFCVPSTIATPTASSHS